MENDIGLQKMLKTPLNKIINIRKMIKHQEIEKIIKKRFEKIIIAFETVRLHFNEDDIRLFRVKVKKLQACLRLFQAAKGQQHSLKIPQSILRYYKVLGVIRNLRMQQRYIRQTLDEKKIVLLENYLNQLSGRILQHIAIADKLISGVKSFEKEEAKLLKLLPKRLSAKTKQKLVHSEIKRLEKFLTPVFPADQSLHETRKILKGLLYVWPEIEDDMPLILPYAFLSNMENIDTFTIVLGHFHDVNVAISLLHADFSTIETDESEKIVLRDIENIWNKEREAAHQDIYQYLQNEQFLSTGINYSWDLKLQ
jgi:hypothetical protein